MTVRILALLTVLLCATSAAWAQLARLFIGDGQLARADAALEKATSGDLDDPLVCDSINRGLLKYLQQQGLDSVRELTGSLRLHGDAAAPPCNCE